MNRWSVVAFILMSAPPCLFGQGFGQNHVVVDDFKWKLRSTDHFDIYYYDASAPLVPAASKILEDGFASVTAALNLSPSTTSASGKGPAALPKWTRRPFFLYASPNDFQQSNIVQVGEGTGGVTEPFKDRFMVFNDGSLAWLEEVTMHEFVHIMQFYVLISGFWKSARIVKTVIYPLWMMEGMPGFITKHIESSLEEMTLRDAASSGGLLPLSRLDHFGHLKPHQVTLAYKQGAAAMEFLASQYGPRKVGDFLKLFENRFEASAALSDLVGLDIFKFEKKYEEYLETKYAHEIRTKRLREPSIYGAQLSRPDRIPQFNTCPVFSPDKKWLYYLSTRAGHPPEIYRMDLRTAHSVKLLTVGESRLEHVSLGHFASLSRVLTLSPDGNTLVFSGTKTHRDGLYFYDVSSRRLTRRELPGFAQVAHPRFSPDGTKIAFSGMKDSATDIYLYDVRSQAVERLTEDPEDDQMPVFTADGAALIYSSEVSHRGRARHLGRRLTSVTLSDRRMVQLEDMEGSSRDPVVSPDGRRVLFILEEGGLSEIAELELASGKVKRLSRTIGGMFTPVYAPDGEIAFASLRRGDVHLYKGLRSDFLDEEIPPTSVISELPGMARHDEVEPAMGEEKPYRFTASTDLFLPALFFSSPGGLFLTSYWQGSELLGNHGASLAGTFNSSHGFFEYSSQYAYSRYRAQVVAAAAGRGQRDLYDPGRRIGYNESIHAQFAGLFYPLDRYHRVEFGLTTVSDVAKFGKNAMQDSRQSRLLSYALVRDTVKGRYLVATRGNRLRLGYSNAVDSLGGNQRYDTGQLEAHQFIELGAQSALALRTAAISSVGPDRTAFLLGGVGGVRGYDRTTSREFGNRIAVANAELRFPIFKDLNYYMWYFFPDFYFKAIFGSLFADTGFPWNSDGELARAHWRDMRSSVGVGIKIFTFVLQEFPFTVSLDYARRTTERHSGILYVYLGSLF